MSSEILYRRGDVVLVPLPWASDSAQRKVRPAVVVQNDIGNRYSPNLIVLAVSSRVPSREYPTNHQLASGTAGLDRDSVVTASVIQTIPASTVLKRLGRLDVSDMGAVDECLGISLNSPSET